MGRQRSAPGDGEPNFLLLKSAGRLARFGGWSLDVRSGELSASEEIFDLLGVTQQAQQIPYEVALAMHPSGQREDVRAAIDRCASDGTPFDLESVIIDAAGNRVQVRIVGEAVRDDSGEIVRISGALQDIMPIASVIEQQAEENTLWRSALDTVLDPVVLIDREWCVRYANASAVEIAETPLGQLTSLTIWELFPETNNSAWRSTYEGAMHERRVGSMREYVTRLNRWLDVEVLPFDDGIAAVFRDVTADEAAKRLLTEQATRLELRQRMLGEASDAIMELDSLGRITYWNDSAARIYDVAVADALGQPWWSLVTVLDEQGDVDRETVRTLSSTIAAGTAVEHPARVRTLSGRIVDVDCRWTPVAVGGSSNGADVILGIHTDQTGRNAERAAHRRIEADLGHTLDQISVGIIFLDRQWRYTFVNEAGARYSQNSRSRLIGTVVWDLYPEAFDSSFGIIYRRAMDERVTGTVRDYYSPLDTWFEATAYPIDDGIAIILGDVTEDQRRREELERSRREALERAALLEAARDAMIVLDLDGTIRYWNSGAATLYDRSREEALGIGLQVLLSAGDDVDGALTAVTTHGYWQGEFRHRMPSGRSVVAECRWQTLVDESGALTGIFAVHSDMTELRAQQEASFRDQRIESLGTLAGGIAHDLNNVLTPLLMAVQLLRDSPPEDDTASILETMEASVRHGAELIRQVLTFARGSDTPHDVIELRTIMDDVARMVLSTLPKSIDAVVTVPHGLAVVADATQISQVLINLVTNARHAMPTGGRMEIRATVVEAAESLVGPTFLNPGQYVCVSVEDTGHGMDSATLDKVFEPFFTTKAPGEGTGLGLSTSRAIVRSHGGRLAVYSEPGHGTRFDLYLPAANAERPVMLSDATTTLPTVGAGQLIVVVDDESAVRELVCQTLESTGYRTLQASNGREAIEVIVASTETVQLVFTDLMMPIMDGAALAAYLAEYHPSIAIVATSGLAANSGVIRAAGVGVEHFIAKPFAADTMLRTVADALALRHA